MPVVRDDIHRLDDVAVLQRAPDAELGGDLLLVLALALALALRAELLHRIRRPAVLRARLDQAHRPARARAEHAPPLAVLL